MPASPGRYRRVLALGTVTGLAVAGFLAWHLLKKPNPTETLKAAEDDYAKGAAALTAKDGPGAAAAFDQAVAKADEALGKFEELHKSGKLKDDEAAALRGTAYWVKARALRDRAFARALAGGNPLPETLDSSTKELYRNYLAIPDEAERKAATTALDEAYVRAPAHPDIVKDVLRVRLSFENPRWSAVATLAKATLHTTPDDSRANYLLARIEFEQFDEKNLPIAPEKRKADRVLKAKSYLEASKTSGNYPLWRTLDLDVRITRWLLAQPAADRPGFDAAAETARLRDLLFDPKSGALARAAAGEAFDSLSRFDVAGITELHRAAVELAAAAKNAPRVASSPKGDEEDAARVATALKAALGVTKALTEHPVGKTIADDVVDDLTAAAAAGRPAAAPADWAAFHQDLDAFAKAAAAKKMVRASSSVRLAELRLATGDAAAAEAWYAEAAAWPKMAADTRVEIHARLLDLKTARGAPAAETADDLKALAGQPGPKAAAARAFFAGVEAERAGRLGEAFTEFARAAGDASGGDYMLRAYAALPGTALVIGKPTDAANYARELDRGWDALAKLDRFGQTWAAAHLTGRDEAVALLVVGQAQAQRQRLERKDKAKGAAGEAAKWAETATGFIRKLDPKGNPALAARLARLEVLAAAGLTAEAKAAADELRTAFPAATAAILRAEIPATDVPARTAADARAKAVGGAFWAEWLASTNRVPDAATELEKTDKALAGLVRRMEGSAAAALIRAVAGGDDASLLTAEKAAHARAKAAVKLLADGKMEEAAKAFDALAEVAALKVAAGVGKAATGKKG
jgi:hypothetical protein